MKCPNCGNEISDNSNFCNICGAKIELLNDEQQVQEQIEPIDNRLIECPSCGEIIPETAIYCPFCQKKVEIQEEKSKVVKMFCPHCGRENDENDEYCKYCNNNLHKKPSDEKKAALKIGIIVIIAVVVATLIIIVGTASSENKESTSSKTTEIVYEDEEIETEEVTTKAPTTKRRYTTSTTVAPTTEEPTTEEPTTEEPTTSPDDYKASCKTIDFETLARNPDKYTFYDYKFTGEVVQVIESSWSDTVELRVNITKVTNEYIDDYYTDTVYCTVEIPDGEDKILEDDIITFWGTCEGEYSYTSVLGSTITLPKIEIKYYELVG